MAEAFNPVPPSPYGSPNNPPLAKFIEVAVTIPVIKVLPTTVSADVGFVVPIPIFSLT